MRAWRDESIRDNLLSVKRSLFWIEREEQKEKGSFQKLLIRLQIGRKTICSRQCDLIGLTPKFLINRIWIFFLLTFSIRFQPSDLIVATIWFEFGPFISKAYQNRSKSIYLFDINLLFRSFNWLFRSFNQLFWYNNQLFRSLNWSFNLMDQNRDRVGFWLDDFFNP